MKSTETVLIAPESPGGETVQARVAKVFDGDGFLANIDVPDWKGRPGTTKQVEVSVRLGFIDAPEMDQPGGQEAKDFLTNLIDGRTLQLIVLTKMDTGSSYDRYGRAVCVPYLTHSYATADFQAGPACRHRVIPFGSNLTLTRNVELEMVLNGWAWVVERYGPDERYLEALKDAQADRRGIWASDTVEAPWAFKERTRKARRLKRQMDFLADLESPEPCPEDGCTGHQVKRHGRFGDFTGCSEYPTCSFSRSVAGRSAELRTGVVP